MPQPVIRLALSELLKEQFDAGELGAALEGLANSGGVKLLVETGGEACIGIQGSATERERTAAAALSRLLGHMESREAAVADLAQAMMGDYEELNMLYRILPLMATRVNDAEIGALLVEEAARMLNCRRVSLLVPDEGGECLRVLASRGLPPEAAASRIAIEGSVAGLVFEQDGLLMVGAESERSVLPTAAGRYETPSFAVVRVPLMARGEPLGVLTATEKEEGTEFTARDRKLLEGLSAVSASALLNCRFHARIKEQMLSTIRALASAVDAKDHYTHDHSSRVAAYCVAMAERMGVADAERLHRIELAGLLHDIGKIGVPDGILNKRGRLTEEEMTVVRAHVVIGARIVGCVPDLGEVSKAILHHHERYDGAGYPEGLAGERIPFASRLIAVADTYDSLTTDRPYRAGAPASTALAELTRCSGRDFDPKMVAAMQRVIREGERGAAAGACCADRSSVSQQGA